MMLHDETLQLGLTEIMPLLGKRRLPAVDRMSIFGIAAWKQIAELPSADHCSAFRQRA